MIQLPTLRQILASHGRELEDADLVILRSLLYLLAERAVELAEEEAQREAA